MDLSARRGWLLGCAALVCVAALGGAQGCERRAQERVAPPELDESEALLRANKPREAAAVLERALPGKPSAAGSARLGLIYVQLGEWKRATSHLEQAHGQKPDVALGSLLALARAASGDLEGARALAPKHYAKQPGSELGLLVAAALARKDGDQVALQQRLASWRDERGAGAPAELLAALGALFEATRDRQAARQAYQGVQHARVADPAWAAGLALVHQRQDRPNAARALLSRLVQLHPEHREAWIRLADVAVAAGDSALARRALAKLPREQTEPLWLTGLRARVLLLEHKPKHACELLGVALQRPSAARDAASAEMKLLHARCLAESGRPQDAEPVLDELAAHPELALRAALQAAELELLQDRPAQALARLAQLASAHPKAAAVHYWTGRAHETQKAWPEAAQAYGAYLERARRGDDDERADVLYRLAVVNEAMGEVATAARLLQAALIADPDAVEPLRALAALEPEREAETMLRNHIGRALHSVPARNALAELLASQQRFDEAEQVHRDALAAEPDDARGHAAYASFLSKRARRDEAIAVLERARAGDPQQRVVLAMLANAYAEAGQSARAAEAYEQVLVQTPDSIPALNNLAFLYADALGRLDEALALARRAKARAPAWPEVEDTLGWVLSRRGEYEEALPLLERAAQALPKEPRVLFHLGATQLGAGQRAAGKRTLRRALALGAAFPEAERAAALLSDG